MCARLLYHPCYFKAAELERPRLGRVLESIRLPVLLDDNVASIYDVFTVVKSPRGSGLRSI